MWEMREKKASLNHTLQKHWNIYIGMYHPTLNIIDYSWCENNSTGFSTTPEQLHRPSCPMSDWYCAWGPFPPDMAVFLLHYYYYCYALLRPAKGVTVEALGLQSVGREFNSVSEELFRASYSENGECWFESRLMPCNLEICNTIWKEA